MPSIRLGDYHFLTSWKILVVGIVSLSLLLKLGIWQLYRCAEKKKIIQAFAEQEKASPIKWETRQPYPKPYQRVILQGKFLPLNFLLDNQFYKHEWGYHVLTPFHIDNSNQVVLIDRGWVKGDVTKQHLPLLNTSLTQQKIIGYTYFPQQNVWIKQPPLPATTETVMVIEQFLPNIFKSVLQYPVLPFMIRLENSMTFNDKLNLESTVLKKTWQVVSVSPARHLAYAIQWFALAFSFVVVFVAVQLKRENPHEAK